MYVGNTVQLTGTVNPSNTTESTLWTSSNTDVATVSDTGLVTAKSAGTATITFKNSSGTKLDSCTVTVVDVEGVVYTTAYIVPGVTMAGGEVVGKIDSKGNKVWTINEYYYFPYEVTTLKNGNIVVACTKLLKHTHNDDEYYGTDGGEIYILNKKGQIISSFGKNYNGYGYRYVASSKDGGFYFCNWYDPDPEYSLQQKGNIAVYKSSCSGEIEWSYTVAYGLGKAMSISGTQDNGVVFYYDGYIYKLNENGTLEWKIRGSSSIAVLPNGNIATITGSTLKIINSSGNEILNTVIDSAFSYIATSLDNYIYLAAVRTVAKYDENGKRIWQKSMSSNYWTKDSFISAIATFSDGSVVVGTGTGNSNELVKYDKNGNLIFEKTLGSSPVQDITIVKE